MEKMASDGPKWGQEDFFPTNPDLADILGRTDLNFANFIFLTFWTPHFWISRSPDFQKSGLGRASALARAWAWAGRAREPLGWAGWALK